MYLNDCGCCMNTISLYIRFYVYIMIHITAGEIFSIFELYLNVLKLKAANNMSHGIETIDILNEMCGCMEDATIALNMYIYTHKK